jgi:hypothetical protein
MYSVMAIFKPSIVWGFFEYAEFFFASEKKYYTNTITCTAHACTIEDLWNINTLSVSLTVME